MTLEEIKQYTRVDGDFEDELLLSFQEVAETYLLDAGVKKDYTRSTYKLAVLMLVSHYFNNRELAVIGTITTEFPYGLRCIIQQLQLLEEII